MESIEYLNKLIEDSRNISKIEEIEEFINFGDFVKVQLSDLTIENWRIKDVHNINNYIFKLEIIDESGNFYNIFNKNKLSSSLDYKNKHYINYLRQDLIKLTKKEIESLKQTTSGDYYLSFSD